MDDGGPHDGTSLEAPAADGPRGDGPLRDDGTGPTTCGNDVSGLVTCNGYEDPRFIGWIVDESLGTAAQDTSRVYRGLGSLHAQTDSGGAVAAVLSTRFGPYSSGDLFARAYFYVPSTTRLDNVALMIVGESDAPWDHVAFSIGSLDDPEVWIEEIRRVTRASVPMPFDRWVCIQVHIAIDDKRGMVELRLDDELVAARSGVDTLPAGGYSEVSAGLPWTNGGNPPAEVWVDELIVATEPIPCD
jgi:hypothetical protein